MKLSALLGIAVLSPSFACGGGSDAPAEGVGGGASASTSATASSATSASAAASSSSLGASGAGATTGSGGGTCADGAVSTIAIPRISAGAPAFASTNAAAAGNADDHDPTTNWAPDKLPAWIAYDLSKVLAAERQSVVVVWNAEHAADYINAAPAAGTQMPTDYTLEINAAPGGTAAPPESGWVTVATVAGNLRNTVEHSVALGGGNWVRMSITGGTDPTIAIDLDVFSTPNGDTDAWMFMGDSITHMTMWYPFANVPKLVNDVKADRWPALINAAIGGTSTATAVSIIGETLSGYPGRYVVLAYGTNDHAADFHMEELVQTVLAACKIPVVPRMPWSQGSPEGEAINQKIDALYLKYPEIVRGPDLWAAFLNRTDLIPAGDVHPNSAGQAFLRQQWATMMATIP